MHKLVALVIVLSTSAFSIAQEVRTEVVSPPGISDSKPNSDDVPDTYTVDGKFERVIVVRMKHKTDLLAGIGNAVEVNGIRNAVILAGTGSVTSYHYHVVCNTSFPTKNIFVKNVSAPADIVGMNGYIVGGRVHAHIAFSDESKAFGGHLEPGTSVFTFAIVTLGVLGDNSDFSRVDDKDYR